MSVADSQKRCLMRSKKEDLAEGFEVGSFSSFPRVNALKEWGSRWRLFLILEPHFLKWRFDNVCFSLARKSVYHWQIHLLLLGRRWDQSTPMRLQLKLRHSNWDSAWCWEDIGEKTGSLWERERKEEKKNQKYRAGIALPCSHLAMTAVVWNERRRFCLSLFSSLRNKTKQNSYSSGISC